jgi:hypothetical protein
MEAREEKRGFLDTNKPRFAEMLPVRSKQEIKSFRPRAGL